jgi:AcrR family transcriptional regulator
MMEAGQPSNLLDTTARERLLAAASDLFSRKGYSATTTREIVAAARVTKPVLYYYFQNKEGIYVELMRKAFAKLDTLLDASQNQRGSATQRLFRLSDRVFSLFLENIQSATLMFNIYFGKPQGAPFFDFDAYFLKFEETVRRLIKIGIQQREFRKGILEDMTWLILGAVSVATSAHLFHAKRGMDRKRLARMLKLVFQGFSTKWQRKKGE